MSPKVAPVEVKAADLPAVQRLFARLRDAIEAVMQLHATIDADGRKVCQTCDTPAPCSTVRTIRQEMGR